MPAARSEARQPFATPDSSQIPSSQPRSRYSCVGCRRRKQRCDKNLPSCTRCARLLEKCMYESTLRNQPVATLARSHARTVQFLQHLLNSDTDELDEPWRKQVRRHLEDQPIMTEEEPGSVTPSEPSVIADVVQAHAHDRHEHSRAGIDTVGEEGRASSENDILLQMSLNEEGQLGHYGATSLIWQSPPVSFSNPLATVSENQPLRSRVVQQVPASSHVQGPASSSHGGLEPSSDLLYGAGGYRSIDSYTQTWETIAANRIELEYGESTAKMINHLLKVYFTWQRTHGTVYRPVFVRDMALDGPYFNRFLLHAICAQATRYSDLHHGGASGHKGSNDHSQRLDANIDFFAAAKSLLSEEMDKASSIPTIQGLLLLGQRECGRGNMSQGWQYTGMALSSIRDMGIHLNHARFPAFGGVRLSQEDAQMRQRVFWSAFAWDKTISLALGRTPNLLSTQHELPDPILDQTEDNDEWAPYWTHGGAPKGATPVPVQRSWTSLTFRHFVALCEIIQSIIMSLYSFPPVRSSRQAHFVERMKPRLSAWYDRLPPQIKLDVENLPPHCPPPHVLSVNVLYRAAWILLYRLFLPDAPSIHLSKSTAAATEAANVCTGMSTELHHLFRLQKRSFDLKNLSYIMCWAMYSAATIDALDFHSSEPARSAAASERLGLTLHVLEKGSLQNTVIKRSVEIIRHRLRSPVAHYRPVYSPLIRSHSVAAGQSHASPLPALAQTSMAASTSDTESAAPLHDLNGSSRRALEVCPAPVDAEEGNQALPTEHVGLGSLYGQLLDAGFNADFLQGMLAMPSAPQPVSEVSEVEWTSQAWSDQNMSFDGTGWPS